MFHKLKKTNITLVHIVSTPLNPRDKIANLQSWTKFQTHILHHHIGI